LHFSYHFSVVKVLTFKRPDSNGFILRCQALLSDESAGPKPLPATG